MNSPRAVVVVADVDGRVVASVGVRHAVAALLFAQQGGCVLATDASVPTPGRE
jgi:hypothetical protein